MRWLRLCGWEEGAAVAEIGSTAENLRDGGAFSGSAWRKAVPGFGVLQAATPEGCMTIDMIDFRAFANPEAAEMASAWAAREAKDRRMNEAAI
jgi:hypothetical protein